MFGNICLLHILQAISYKYQAEYTNYRYQTGHMIEIGNRRSTEIHHSIKKYRNAHIRIENGRIIQVIRIFFLY